MQHDETYPYLSDLLGGYFHQDAWADGATVESIIEEYKRTSWPYEQLGTRADLQRLLHLHDDDPAFLKTLEATFSASTVVGENDEDARKWLRRVLALLEQ